MRQLKSFLPAITLTVICLVVALLLAATNLLTREPIAKQEEKAAFERMSIIFPDADTFNAVEISDELEDLLNNKDTDSKCDEVHEALDDQGNLLGYVFVTRSLGYAGDVIVTSGLESDGSVLHVIVTAPDETPKLGKKVEDDSFTSQFSGINAGEHAGAESGCVQMISGATISSKAVCNAFNVAVDAFNILSEKGVIGA